MKHCTETSKVKSKHCKHLSSSVIVIPLSQKESINAPTFFLLNVTPLGVPVLPEVNSTYARSSSPESTSLVKRSFSYAKADVLMTLFFRNLVVSPESNTVFIFICLIISSHLSKGWFGCRVRMLFLQAIKQKSRRKFQYHHLPPNQYDAHHGKDL